MEAQVSGGSAEASRCRSTGPDAGRIDQESAKESVYVLRGAGDKCTGTTVGRDEAVNHRLEAAHLVVGQPDGHEIKLGRRPCMTQASESSSGLSGVPVPEPEDGPNLWLCDAVAARDLDTRIPTLLDRRATCWRGSLFS